MFDFKNFETRSGRAYLVLRELPKGAQGRAFEVRGHDGRRGVLKLFAEPFRTKAIRDRIAKLVERNLHAACPMLCAPTDMVDESIGLGHVAPLAPGLKLDTYLEAPNGRFLDHVIAAAAIAAALAVLERMGLGHGDLQGENILVDSSDGVLRPALIDFDNLLEPGLASPAAGHPRYYAPEIRAAVADRRTARPDLRSDRYALGVLMHELLLARHPAGAFEHNPAGFDRLMRSGKWPDDPARPSPLRGEGGFRAECLDPPLQNLLRRALAGEAADRPTAAEWFTALRRAAENVYVCDHCRYPCVVDGGKFVCVQCRRPFPAYRLTVRGRTVATLRRGALVIGRRDLGDAPMVSPRHAVLRRCGPDALIQPIGAPVHRVHPGGREILAKDREHLLRPGERLLFGSIEAKVEVTKAA